MKNYIKTLWVWVCIGSFCHSFPKDLSQHIREVQVFVNHEYVAQISVAATFNGRAIHNLLKIFGLFKHTDHPPTIALNSCVLGV